jgi:hypothetical protein
MTRHRRRSRKSEVVCWPVPIGDHCYRDVNGNIVDLGHDLPGVRDLYLAVARSTLTTFQEIFEAMYEIVYDPRGSHHEGPSAWQKLRRKIVAGHEEAKRDAALLKLPLPVEEAFAIWRRSCDNLRLCADLTPDPDSAPSNSRQRC